MSRVRKFSNVSNLKAWLSRPEVLENKVLDFKEQIPSDPDNLRKIFCAFANGDETAKIIFGVTNHKRVVGIQMTAQQLKDRIIQILGTNVQPATIKFNIVEEIKVNRNTKSVFIVEVLNSDYISKPHIFIKNDAVYIPIRKDGSCDYLKNHNEIRDAFLIDGLFYQKQSGDIKLILERLSRNPDCNLKQIEVSLLIKFRSYLSSQKDYDSNVKNLDEELDQIISEHSEIQSLGVGVRTSDVESRLKRIEGFTSKINNHLRNFNRYYD